MNYQQKFAPGVVPRLREKIKKEDENLIEAYLNKEKFIYDFQTEDYAFCDFEPIPSNLGEQLKATFIRNLSPTKKNDFRTSDFECAKLLYENLRITPRQAADKDFWNFLHHTDMYTYIHLRWNEIEKPSRGSRETYIFRHWLMTLSSQKHLINYPLTTLWWSIHLTIDQSKKDPYELSRIYFNNNRYRTVTYGGSSYVRHKEAILGILEFHKENNISETKEIGDTISKFVNLLGGTKPLGYFDRAWFKNQLEKRFPDLVKEKKHPFRAKEVSGQIDNNEPPRSFPTLEETENHEVSQIKEENTYIESNPNILSYLIIHKDGRNYLNNKFEKNAQFCVPINKECKNGFIIQCYDNGRINKVSVFRLLLMTMNPATTPTNEFSNKAKLLNVFCIPEDCLVLISVNEPYQGKLGKIYKTEWIPDRELLNLLGKEISIHRNKITYKILPQDLYKKVYKLISKSPSGFFPRNNSFYKREWEFIGKYFRAKETLERLNIEPEIYFPPETSNDEGNSKFFNIYETGLYFYSKFPPTESITHSVSLPSNLHGKFLYFCYDNGQVAKFPLERLPDLPNEVREQRGKYLRAGLAYIAVGVYNSNILVSVEKGGYGKCYKIHPGEVIPESENLHDQGVEIINKTNSISYTLLPPDLDPNLKSLIITGKSHCSLLNTPANRVQKNILQEMVPEFFE